MTPASAEDQAFAVKTYMRKSKKVAIFRLDGDEEFTYRTVNDPDSPEVRKFLLDKYPTNATIFNRDTKTFERVA